MTSGITIGRFGLDIELPGLMTWNDAGTTVQVSATNWTLGVDEGRAIRQQLLGLASTPGTLVPVTSTDDPHRDGYYRVLDVSITSEALLVLCGHISWTATLERPTLNTAMRPELTVAGTTRTGKPAGITASHWVAVPEGYGWGQQAGTLASVDTRYLADGSYLSILYGAGLIDARTILLAGPVSAHYVGACRVEMDGFTVIGKHSAHDPANFLATNGLVTITPATSPTALFSMQVQNPASGPQPAPTQTYEIELGAWISSAWVPSTDMTIHSVSTILESVERTVLRFAGIVNLTGASVPRNTFTVDLSFRRGDLGVDLSFRFVEPNYYGLGFVTPITGGYHTITGSNNCGFRADSPDPDGVSPVIIHQATTILGSYTDDLTNGRTYYSVFGYYANDFWVGASLESAAQSDAATLQDAYFSTLRERQLVVAP